MHWDGLLSSVMWQGLGAAPPCPRPSYYLQVGGESLPKVEDFCLRVREGERKISRTKVAGMSFLHRVVPSEIRVRSSVTQEEL